MVTIAPKVRQILKFLHSVHIATFLMSNYSSCFIMLGFNKAIRESATFWDYILFCQLVQSGLDWNSDWNSDCSPKAVRNPKRNPHYWCSLSYHLRGTLGASIKNRVQPRRTHVKEYLGTTFYVSLQSVHND
jgi:hypothetical protein